MKNVTLIGTGQIGASIGLALKVEHPNKYRVVGYDPDQDTHARAEKIKAVDSAEWNLDVAVRDADIVVISLPVLRTYDILETIAPYLKDGTTVTDTCNTKRSILRWAEELLPSNVSFRWWASVSERRRQLSRRTVSVPVRTVTLRHRAAPLKPTVRNSRRTGNVSRSRGERTLYGR